MPFGLSGKTCADQLADLLEARSSRCRSSRRRPRSGRRRRSRRRAGPRSCRRAGGHDVLGDVAAHVGGRAVDLARVLAREAAAAVAAAAAVGVDDDLAAGQAGVAVRPADHEAPGRVHVVGDPLLVQQLARDHRLDHVLDEVLADLLQRHVRVVLGRDDDRVDAHRLVVLVLDGDLGLAVGAQVADQVRAAAVGEPLRELVGQQDRHRHQLGRLVRGVAEHDPLVAGALLVVLLLVDAHRDVGRLPLDRGEHAAGLVVEAVGGVRVADLLDRLADDLRDVGVDLGRDLAGDEREARRDDGLAGHAAVGVLGEDRVENGVGDLVGDLVRMPLGHRFRSEQVVLRFHYLPPFANPPVKFCFVAHNCTIFNEIQRTARRDPCSG